MVEAETVRPSQLEHHNFFAAVLRDPSPISPGRAREMKSTHTGSYSGRITTSQERNKTKRS